MLYNELDNDQRRQFIETLQTYEAFRAARVERRRRYFGSMRWKRVRGRDYLVRSDGRGGDSSLGPRSAETEGTLANFKERRVALDDQLKGLKSKLDRMAKINRALRLGRVPTLVARVIRKFDEVGLFERNLTVTGTNALYAYEAKAGVQLGGALLATGDIDLLLNAKASLKLVMEEGSEEGIIGLLRRVDKSFAIPKNAPFRATNRDGYMVELIMAEANPPWRDDGLDRIGEEDDLRAAPIHGLNWLLSSPRLEQIVIGEDGLPARMVAPDPRAFALHKLWLSERADRDPVKKPRDREQAVATLKIIDEFLPMLDFDDRALSGVPAALRARTSELRELARARQ